MASLAPPMARRPLLAAGDRPRLRLAVVLGVALGLHALLISIPLRQGDTPTRPASVLSVEFERAPPDPAEPVAPREPVAEPTAPAARDERPSQLRAPSTPEARTPPSDPPVTRPPEAAPIARYTPRPEVTADRLLRTIRGRSWRAPSLSDAPAAVDYGDAHAWPRSWDRPVLALEANRFDDAVLPTEVEILDRWRAADGAHEVVMRTPTGHTLCGRALAWNPMEPLVEPIMMFRSCAGGGKRRFVPGVVPDER